VQEDISIPLGVLKSPTGSWGKG